MWVMSEGRREHVTAPKWSNDRRNAGLPSCTEVTSTKRKISSPQ